MSAPPPADAITREHSITRSAFWPTVWLIIAVVAIKATYVTLSTFWTWATPKDHISWLYVRWAAAVTEADVFFAMCFGIVGTLLLFAVRRHPKAARLLFGVFLALGALFVLYAIVGRQVFSYYAAPLTYQLLTLGGEPARMWSSLEPFLTARALFALVAVPLCYLLLVWLASRLDSAAQPFSRRVVRGSLLVALLGWILLGRQFMANDPDWFNRSGSSRRG